MRLFIKILSLSTISTPTPLDDLKECNEHPWVVYNFL
jgi:hypothetical protein